MIAEMLANETLIDKVSFMIPKKPDKVHYSREIIDKMYTRINDLPHEPCAKEGKKCKCNGNIYYGTWMSVKVSLNKQKVHMIKSEPADNKTCSFKAFKLRKKKKNGKCFCQDN